MNAQYIKLNNKKEENQNTQYYLYLIVYLIFCGLMTLGFIFIVSQSSKWLLLLFPIILYFIWNMGNKLESTIK